MRAQFAITVLLAAGMLLSLSGFALGASALTDTHNASASQYSRTGEPSTGEPSTGEPSTGRPSTGGPSTGRPSTGGPYELPFTGSSSLPLLLMIGAGLLVAGIVLRNVRITRLR